MLVLTKEFVKLCSTILGRFSLEDIGFLSTRIDSQLNSLPEYLREKFKQLIPFEKTIAREIQLAVINHFKQRYFSNSIPNHQRQRFLLEDEFTLAYAFLLGYCVDHLSEEDVDNLKTLFSIREAKSLFELYEQSEVKLDQFFVNIIHCGAGLEWYLVRIKMAIQEFDEFMVKYKDFLTTFELYYAQLSSDERSASDDTSSSQNYLDAMSSFMLSKEKSSKSSVLPKQGGNSLSLNHFNHQIISSLTVPKKGLCVIINVSEFDSNSLFVTHPRRGSNNDVELIKTVFTKLNFTILYSNFNFTKENFNQAVSVINNRNDYQYHDCLIIFIMSHGLLHSFFSADTQEVIIRNFVRCFADSSVSTIWSGKPRLFFFQACRSPWPANNPLSNNQNRTEITPNDLSPGMLVAYSCSESEVSKRNIKWGSDYIQIFCLTLLQFSHRMSIQQLLDFTAQFLIAHSGYLVEMGCRPLHPQRPEYIERQFNPKFRFTSHCVLNSYSTWSHTDQLVLGYFYANWDVIFEFMKKKSSG